MIRILNKRNRPVYLPEVKYFSIDRSSPVGNPFFMKSEATRDEVCDRYQKWFDMMLQENVNKQFLSYLEEIYQAAKIGEVALLCWCTPKRCHGETIKRYIELRLENEFSN